MEGIWSHLITEMCRLAEHERCRVASCLMPWILGHLVAPCWALDLLDTYACEDTGWFWSFWFWHVRPSNPVNLYPFGRHYRKLWFCAMRARMFQLWEKKNSACEDFKTRASKASKLKALFFSTEWVILALFSLYWHHPCIVQMPLTEKTSKQNSSILLGTTRMRICSFFTTLARQGGIMKQLWAFLSGRSLMLSRHY